MLWDGTQAMQVRKRKGSSPSRRIGFDGPLAPKTARALISRCSYVGAAFHKLKPADYGLIPPSSPRPNKSVCDDHRPLLKAEAEALLEEGIRRGMVSKFEPDSVPKYIWAVDEHGEVYEAKTKPPRETAYHGYRLGEDDAFRVQVRRAWRAR